MRTQCKLTHPEVQELEKRNLHNQQWTFTDGKSGLGEIFNGESPFGDGEVEALDGLPEGFDIPQLPEGPQEYSPGLDKGLKQKARVYAILTTAVFLKLQIKIKM